ncbi:hypothetical protein [Aestuariivivens insulae]|uniref:hypothetical protein n=1 Tax=Aestuariivivens insulae TaxID=1621988 RepID=UPI001F56B53B|nr:hypothetical protein [Aestuariivivens insulae]
MKNLILTILLFVVSLTINAQDTPKVGDKFVINNPSGQHYNHIAFPKLNIISKRGKIANYKSIIGEEVIVKEVISKSNGNVYVILEKEDGSKFFGFQTKAKANYKSAISSGELSPTDS